MNKETCMKAAEESILHTYNRFPVVFDHGEGVYLYDTDGKEYLDFAAGIAVQAFGYGNKEYGDALKAQIDKIMHTSNLYYNVLIYYYILSVFSVFQCKCKEKTGCQKALHLTSGFCYL